MTKIITITGARTNNLKGVDCAIPHNELTIISGVSGSGKSSLAFDTLFAEGQRRFVESLSPYARQFIEQMKRPDVDGVDNIPPAIAIEQKNKVKSARSTIATATETHDYLRLLYARLGETIDPETGKIISKMTPQRAVEVLLEEYDGARGYILSPILLSDSSRRESVLQFLFAAGYNRFFQDGKVIELTAPEDAALPESDNLLVLIDRLKVSARNRNRLVEAVVRAFQMGKGELCFQTTEGATRTIFEGFRSQKSGRRFREPEPALFSFYSPLGACDKCSGFGHVLALDEGKVIPTPWKSLDERPIAAWNTPGHREMYAHMRRTVEPDELRFDVPINELSQDEIEVLWNGNMDSSLRARRRRKRKKAKKPGQFPGIRGFFEWVESKRYKMHMRVFIAKFRTQKLCPDCKGARLVQDALNVRLRGRTIDDLCRLSTIEIQEFINGLHLSKNEREIAGHLVEELQARLDYLISIGLGYLTMDRPTRTLSGGEAQRINLATALGSALTETLYVLDEPTVGLHPRDTNRLIEVLRRMVDRGNTVVVVEHDADVIRASDYIIDIGPGAGELGGRIIYQGSTANISDCEGSPTRRYLFAASRGKKKKNKGAALLTVADELPGGDSANFQSFGRDPKGWIEVRGARENNLKGINARFPLGVLCCVTGVSGSGKTSLVGHCLHGGWARFHGDISTHKGVFDDLIGWEKVDELQHVEARPIGRSLRSNPVTYIKAFDEIRRLFASTREAKAAGLRPGSFSFNSRGGRCEECEGLGFTVVDMQFLADITIVCDKCGGHRYKDPVLAIRYNEKNIYEVLQLTITEACRFFSAQPRIVRRLQPLVDVGLGYLRLGQSTSTLSGGEIQRLKLAEFTGKSLAANRQSVLIFDEPSTGLHAADLDTLLGVFHRLVTAGYSLIVIEHNLAIIGAADWIIDLGPEGGDEGGHIVAEGPPSKILRSRKSHTARFLKAEQKKHGK